MTKKISFSEIELSNTVTNNYINKINEARLDDIIIDKFAEFYSVEDRNISIVTRIVMRPFSESVRRLLHEFFVIFNLSDRKYPDGNFTIENHIQMSRFTSKREAITQLKIDLGILQNTSIVLKQESKVKNTKIWNNNLIHHDIKLFKTTSFIQGIIHFQFHDDFFNLLKDWSTYVPIDIKLFKLSLKYSTAYYLGLRMYNHSKMNAGEANENIISVKSLLETCPTLPKEQDIDFGLKKGIMTPFELNLDILCKDGILKPLGYEYCNKRGVALSDKQLNITTYKTFINLYLRYDLENYINQRQKNIDAKNKVTVSTKQQNTQIKRLTKQVNMMKKSLSYNHGLS